MRPVCLNCAKGMRICEWKLLARRYKGPQRCVILRPRSDKSAVQQQPSLSPMLSVEESRYLLLFRDITADIRSGFFNSIFWTRTILQTSHLIPSIKHALIAIGALYKTMEVSCTLSFDAKKTSLTTAIIHYNFALRQYHKAIQLIKNSLEKGEILSLRTALITSILFTCFESFHGNQNAAIAQFHSGMKLINDRQQNESLFPSQCNDAIENDLMLFWRGMANNIKTYDMAMLCNTALPSIAFSNMDSASPAPNLELPEIFLSSEHARIYWNSLKTSSMQFVSKNAIPIDGHFYIPQSSERDHFEVLTARCGSAIQHCLDYANDTSDFLAAQALRLDQKMSQVLFQSTFQIEESDIGKYNTEYAELLDLAQGVLNYQTSGAQLAGRGFCSAQTSFSFDTLIIYPLFFIATRCRVSQLRRRAITLLSSTYRREGLWDSVLAAKVATWILNMEEASELDEDEISQEAKMTLSSVVLRDMGRVATVTCISKHGATKMVEFTL
jgi:hypothetical protein